MSRSEHQKLKLLYLKEILETQTDAAHPLTAQELIELLARKGVRAERKSIYSDMECLLEYGMDVVQQSLYFGSDSKRSAFCVASGDQSTPSAP